MDKYYLGHKPCQHEDQCNGYSTWSVRDTGATTTYVVDDADKLCEPCYADICLCESIDGYFCINCAPKWFTNFPIETRFYSPEFSWVRTHWPIDW